MARQTKDYDKATLAAALLGYQAQAEVIEAKMAAIRVRLGQHAGKWALARALQAGRGQVKRPQKPHIISPEGRARIAAAQRRRWKAAKAAANGA